MLNQSHIRGVLASYDFSEGSGTALTDKSGNGNNATIVGGTWTTDRFGRTNRAVLLDGVDDYIDCGLANYQGDLGSLISLKVVSLDDADPIIVKGYQNTSIYPPNIRQTIRTTSIALNTFNYYSAGVAVSATAQNSAYITGSFDSLYLAFKNDVAIVHGAKGQQNTVLSNLIDTTFSNYSIRIGTNALNTVYSNIVVDRVMLFNRFLSGHELSKLANRLKIGDMDK